MQTEATQDILIVAGMSGAGRTTAAKTLDDMGWYVVDNLPLWLLTTVADMAERTDGALSQIAAVIDARGRDITRSVRETIAELSGKARVRLLFLEATDEVLVRRYDSVRRPHPLMGEGSLIDGIRAERERVHELRQISDYIIDTTSFNVHQLTTHIRDLFDTATAPKLHLVVQSFGFKYGTPADADLMVDMRFLPNPFWDPQLRDLTGVDAAVSDFVLSREGAREFLDGYCEALKPVFAGYQRENKHHAMLAVGCTGGKHRSVASANFLAAKLAELEGVQVSLRHRDLGRE
ncbi:RNase adapter RapZ [Canibacter sp. lx-72]|uniref:RNase adapter RapZ n=1 Tax=Canibacter zhuwentaonis TaxID=2837491 RepID=UPI001BDD2C70|nr:RNase adapter RapZ [Canibacter zhuwentaonis]MBT1018492.1 RNase adapter RapZ [Canibacter zhuwentaonis]